MAFGRNRERDYLAMNPNGRVPTLMDGDFVLWESNSIMRYLVLAYRPQPPLYPQVPKVRAGVDRWLDWTLSTMQPVDRPVFWALVRTPVEQRDMARIQKDADAEAEVWQVAEAQLSSRRFIEGDDFTIADIALDADADRAADLDAGARALDLDEAGTEGGAGIAAGSALQRQQLVRWRRFIVF